MALVRISADEPIRVRAEVTDPDIVIVLDPSLLRVVDVTAGLKANGILVVNSKKQPEQIIKELGYNHSLAAVDATTIARELLGVNIVNTSMIGALLKATGVVELESLFEPLRQRFGRLAERNIDAMKRAYEETSVKERK